jgi:hypothetical protein
MELRTNVSFSVAIVVVNNPCVSKQDDKLKELNQSWRIV